MSEIHDETREYNVMRVAVWSAILAATVAFWAAVTMALLAWLRIG